MLKLETDLLAASTTRRKLVMVHEVICTYSQGQIREFRVGDYVSPGWTLNMILGPTEKTKVLLIQGVRYLVTKFST